MSFDLLNIDWNYFGFEKPAFLSLALFFVLFLLFEYFPGRNYFYSLTSLKKFIDKHLIKHLIRGSENKRKSWIRTVIVSLIWILLVAAFANPRWDFEEVESFKPNVNLIILLDISKSMDAQDQKPSRLERAKQEIMDIVKKAEAANIGIIAFANQAHIISPVTDDRNAISYLLPSVTTDLVGVQGSNIEAGLRSAAILLKPLQGGVNYVLVMSDGGFENIDKIKSLSKLVKGAQIITYGFGGDEGAPIPDADGKFMQDGEKTVMTKLEKQNLISLSGLDNYIQATYLDDDSEKVINIVSSKVDTIKQKTKLFKLWHDRFYIPLIAAALLILPFFRKGAIFPIIILLFSVNSFAQDENDVVDDPDPANLVEDIKTKIETDSRMKKFMDSMFKNEDQQAQDPFEARQYQAAQEKFSDDYNKAVAQFRTGNYEEAEKYFGIEKDENIDSEYNFGNAQLLQYKIKEAIATYESVLKKQPDHADAKHNLEIAKKLLKNNKNQNKNEDQQDNKDKNKDQQDNKDKSGDQDKNKQDQQDKGSKPNQQGGNGQQNKDSSDNDGKEAKNELNIQAKSILSKVSSDPAKLMKSRFNYEEGKGDKQGSGVVNPKPW